ncbi:hypothetical protein CHLRE_11g467767v5 [Chlamydomonas reinhardtii]|uniref:NADH dehydrogenase [ubiquinone] 1 alpha subcomplex subunit 12 n=1 Tax=Chlamydomonas reinhardtii TaxID=3055 RepID=Q6UP31_CHLRE|nr:uncharacterized protein CHLRE_11g467767v5 [Chlamydomonas reinhardtii]AAQ64638.1 NADH:ubiquinone oxidoreductase B17.2-like subunit [Chlamydomonas reinhardtii]PNW76647.1 hypothetical protein CHLRE_11g467767v5 [Chlamydomonas reinhardtii]|eukprot:XP_001699522.1 NADH:ubiquinone oxidoreductase 18 kDa subunit [Chlamydomonas reinhardtii]
MSLSGYFSRLLEASGKKSVGSFFASWEFGKMLVDGNLAHNVLVRATGAGRLVGTDYNGNRYYENEEAAYGRRRWIVYKDKFDYNPTTIPPEWHGWLNYINDYNPTNTQFKQPTYQIEASMTKTGTQTCYNPKGSWFSAKPRNWRKYESWTPANKSA